MSKTHTAVFGKLRSIFWPVSRHELKKFLPMFFMLFLICFNYSVVRNIKDALIVTAKSSGAEAIPFIKVWVMLPGAILATWIYTRLSRYFSQEKVFCLLLGAFVVYFALFILVFYPYQEALRPDSAADALQALLPSGFKGLIAMYRHWSFTIFYVVSELWACLVLNVLFWGFANQVTTLTEAKRFYAMFQVGANVGTIVAGQVSVFLGNMAIRTTQQGGDGWGGALTALLSLVICSGVLVMIIFRWVNRHVHLDPWIHESPSEHRPKHSLRASFAYLSTSKYLLCIASIVLSYNLVINLVEVVWKDRLRHLYPDPALFNNYLNNVTTMVGVMATCAAFTMPWIIRVRGWKFLAMVAPVVLLLSSAAFFGLLLFQDSIGIVLTALLGGTPLGLVVLFGAIQNCCSKACKYSVFDASQNMAFIPLDHETKLKGKAAIDGVGSRLGKSGGSLIHQGLLMVFASLVGSAPVVSVVVLAVIALWMISVSSLAKQFHSITTGVPAEAPQKQEIVAEGAAPAAAVSAVSL